MMLVYFNLYYKVGLKTNAEHKNEKSGTSARKVPLSTYSTNYL